MWWIFIAFVIWVMFSFLHADIKDHDIRLRLLEERQRKDAPTIYAETKEDSSGVKLEET